MSSGNHTYRIRIASEADSSEIACCLREAFEPYRTAYTVDAYRDTVPSDEGVGERIRKMWIFVAEAAGGGIVGTVACSRTSVDEGHLRGMAVRPEHEGTGVARALLQRARERLRAEGCRRVTLDTTPPLARAARFYERSGFRKSGKIGNFFGMPLIEYVYDLE